MEVDGGAQLFYALAAGSLLLCWAALSLGPDGDFHRRGRLCSVATRPSWLPTTVLMGWLSPHRAPRAYMALCHGAPLVLAAAALAPPPAPLALRLVVAAWLSLYQLAEAAVTHSHRDFGIVYVCWGLALAPLRLARGVALSVGVVLLAGSGYSKLRVGGGAAWARPATLRGVLRTYGALPLAACGPGSPALNRLLVGDDAGGDAGAGGGRAALLRDLVLGALGGGTLLFECVLVPAGALLLPPPLRRWLAVASVGLHVGICASQSFVIGVAFLPNAAVYALAFCSGDAAAVGSASWCLALALAGAWFGAVALRGGQLLPEDWPCTPFALFSWNAPQWEAMFDRFARGRHRLVLTTRGGAPDGLVGRAVTRGSVSPAAMPHGANEVHDGYEQCFGETLVHAPLLGALLEALECQASGRGGAPAAAAATDALVQRVGAWLEREQRLIEVGSGRPLARAAMVVLDECGLIDRVLATSAPARVKST